MAPPSDRASTARLERERSHHDARFAVDGGRRRSTAVYVTNRACQRHYDELLATTPAGSSVLEYGCGTGSVAFDLAERGCRVTGIDLSPVAIEVAASVAAERGVALDLREANAEHLPFGDASFDVVCGSGILHHLDLDRAIAELSRVLKADGRAVFLEPLGHNPLLNVYRRLTPGERTPDEHPLVRADFERLRAGFDEVELAFFSLTAPFAFPLRGTDRFEAVLDRLEAVDASIVRRWPAVGPYGWTVVVDARRPRPRPR